MAYLEINNKIATIKAKFTYMPRHTTIHPSHI